VAHPYDPGFRHPGHPDPRGPGLRRRQKGREHRHGGHLQPRRSPGIARRPLHKRRPRHPAIPEPEQLLRRRPHGGRAVPDLVPPPRGREEEL
ncbi:MAG: hypothetical protein AVDCRST_MAG02-88, partial [uncultured Rubrobacteraceae bacterium]